MGKYQAYPEYKDSEVEWLGEIPTNWQTIFLKRISKFTTGMTPSTTVTEYYSDEKTVYEWVRPEDIIENTEHVNASKFLTKKGWDTLRAVPENSILICCIGTIGKAAYTNKALTTNQQITAASSSFVSKYYFYVLLAARVELEQMATGNVVKILNSERLGQLKVPKLDNYEAKKIASFLDHKTTKIDNLIERQQQLIELLQEKRQAVISHAVTKGLNPDVPMKDSGVEWLGEVPEHWDVLRLKHLISSLESGCSVNAADIPAQTNEIGVLKTSCVYTRSFRASENKTVISEDLPRVKCPVRKGAVIISRMNTPELVGASALVDISIDNIYLPDRLWQTNFNPLFKLIPDYVAHFMSIEGFRNQISLSAEGASSSMQNIAKEDYLAINCLLPAFEEQQEITYFLKHKLSYFAELEQKTFETIQLLQERRIALISAAVTGKIDARNWVAPANNNSANTESQELTA